MKKFIILIGCMFLLSGCASELKSKCHQLNESVGLDISAFTEESVN